MDIKQPCGMYFESWHVYQHWIIRHPHVRGRITYIHKPLYIGQVSLQQSLQDHGINLEGMLEWHFNIDIATVRQQGVILTKPGL
jgi:hypothetical protein